MRITTYDQKPATWDWYSLFLISAKTRSDELIGEIVASINAGTPKSSLWRDDFDRMLETLKAYTWSEIW